MPNNFLFFEYGVFAYVKKHHILFPVLWCPNAWQLIQMLSTIKFLCLAFQLYYQMVDEINIIFWLLQLGWNDISCTFKKEHAKDSLHWEPVGFSPTGDWVLGDLSGCTVGQNVFGQRLKLQVAKQKPNTKIPWQAQYIRVAQVLWSEPYLWGAVLVWKHDSTVKRNHINGIAATMGVSLVNHDPNLACGFKIGSIALHMLRVPWKLVRRVTSACSAKGAFDAV